MAFLPLVFSFLTIVIQLTVVVIEPEIINLTILFACVTIALISRFRKAYKDYPLQIICGIGLAHSVYLHFTGATLVIIIPYGFVALIGFIASVITPKKRKVTSDFHPREKKKMIEKELGYLPDFNVDNDGRTTYYVASTDSAIFHVIDCPGAAGLKKANLIRFRSKDEAQDGGYLACSCVVD